MSSSLKFSVPKSEAAIRQLTTAIRLLFQDGDLISVHTLAASALEVLADLCDKTDVKSWRDHAFQESGLTRKDYNDLLHRQWNAIKHADREQKDVAFDEEDARTILFFAILEMGILKLEQTMEIGVYQIWYLAVRREELLSAPGFDGEARAFLQPGLETFRGIETMDREQQLAFGLRVLESTGEPI